LKHEQAVFSQDVLQIDAERMAAKIAEVIFDQVAHQLHRRGAVVGISGGVDSAVVCLLCASALGADRVLALMTPERATAGDSLTLGRLVAGMAGAEVVIEPITSILEAAGCYRRQAQAIRAVIPDFDESWPIKLVLPSVLGSDRLNVFTLVAQLPDGSELRRRLPPEAYQQLLAATNMKQRIRKQLEYYHAERRRYAVAGTPNRLEYDQGFFVKNGDGAADFKPIAHLYKSQVYALARHLGVPEAIVERPPTTDTFSLSQTQEEFYFGLPVHAMDLCLHGRNSGAPSEEVAHVVGLTSEQVERVYRDIDSKRRATRYQHLAPLLVEPISEAGPCAES
jgi:NAD+ synthase